MHYVDEPSAVIEREIIQGARKHSAKVILDEMGSWENSFTNNPQSNTDE